MKKEETEEELESRHVIPRKSWMICKSRPGRSGPSRFRFPIPHSHLGRSFLSKSDINPFQQIRCCHTNSHSLRTTTAEMRDANTMDLEEVASNPNPPQ